MGGDIINRPQSPARDAHRVTEGVRLRPNYHLQRGYCEQLLRNTRGVEGECSETYHA